MRDNVVSYWESADSVVEGPSSDASGYIIDPEYYVIRVYACNLESWGISIGIYLGIEWASG